MQRVLNTLAFRDLHKEREIKSRLALNLRTVLFYFKNLFANIENRLSREVNQKKHGSHEEIAEESKIK